MVRLHLAAILAHSRRVMLSRMRQGGAWSVLPSGRALRADFCGGRGGRPLEKKEVPRGRGPNIKKRNFFVKMLFLYPGKIFVRAPPRGGAGLFAFPRLHPPEFSPHD